MHNTWFNRGRRGGCSEVLNTDIVPHIVVGIGAICAVNSISIVSTAAWVIGKVGACCIESYCRSTSPV